MTPFQNIKPTQAFLEHPALTSAGGATLGYAAASGNPWAILACLGTLAAWLHARRMAKATAAARQAAIAAAVACGDPNSPECIAEAKGAAIAAGQAVMQPAQPFTLPVWSYPLIAACASFAIVAWALHK
jgi:hypothetical protein